MRLHKLLQKTDLWRIYTLITTKYSHIEQNCAIIGAD